MGTRKHKTHVCLSPWKALISEVKEGSLKSVEVLNTKLEVFC